MAKPKFKVGDKVKLLPGIVNDWVRTDEIGKIGIITGLRETYALVDRGIYNWAITYEHIELYNLCGFQLSFPFMEE